MTHDVDRDVLLDAAGLVQLLGQAAHAYMVDDHAEVETLLGAVTRPACRRIAGALLVAAYPWPRPETEEAELEFENVVSILSRR